MITLRGIPVDELGLTLVDGGGGGPDLSGLTLEREAQPWVGRAGQIPSPYATVPARVVRFVVDAEPTTFVDRLALIDWLKDLLMVGPIAIVWADAPMRMTQGLARVFDAAVPSPSWVNIDPRITVEIVCHNAAKYDVEAQSRVIGTTPVMIPCGTLPHGGQVLVKGALSGALSLTYRGLTGEIIGALGLTIPASGNTLTTNDTLIIDHDERALVKLRASDNTLVAVDDWRTSGDFFEMRSAHGHRPLDVWGTLEASATGLYRWRRAYH